LPERLAVRKTYKLFIGGAFPRSESGRSYVVTSPDGDFRANAALASRKDVRDAVRALERLSEIDRSACRRRIQQCFSIKTMVEAYERVYSTIFDLEAKK